MFGRARRSAGTAQGLTYDKIQSTVDTALTAVFSEAGKKAVLYYMSENYSLSLEQASKNPRKLEAALSDLLGEIGWRVVKGRILQECFTSVPAMNTMTIESTSLSDAFGFVRSLSPSFTLAAGV